MERATIAMVAPRRRRAGMSRRSAVVAGKDDLKIAEAKWAAVAAVHGYHCTLCGTVPPYAERAIFFARDLCDRCAQGVDRTIWRTPAPSDASKQPWRTLP
jgi:hypothetical protein